MGAAACHNVARRGARVLAIEQFAIGHSNGSSHGHSRVIRQAYFEHPDYVPLLLRTYELFEELEQRCGSQLLLRCGALYGGRADSDVVAGSRLAAERRQSLRTLTFKQRFRAAPRPFSASRLPM